MLQEESKAIYTFNIRQIAQEEKSITILEREKNHAKLVN